MHQANKLLALCTPSETRHKSFQLRTNSLILFSLIIYQIWRTTYYSKNLDTLCCTMHATTTFQLFAVDPLMKLNELDKNIKASKALFDSWRACVWRACNTEVDVAEAQVWNAWPIETVPDMPYLSMLKVCVWMLTAQNGPCV